MQPFSNRKRRFTIEQFRIDSKRGIATCPAGKRSARRDRQVEAWRYVFSSRDCAVCPMRARCTAAKRARALTVPHDFRERQRLRDLQRTTRFRRTYRRRIVVEHRLARLVQLGIRKARYFGKAKVAFQIAIAAAMANLGLANGHKALFCPLVIKPDRIAHTLHTLGLRNDAQFSSQAISRAA